MKNLSRILRLVVVTSLIATAHAQVVSIPDPGLNAAILAALGKATGPLTVQDMLGLTNLNASNRGVVSLEGLGAAHNLTEFDIVGANQLTSLTLPAGLTSLTTLALGYDKITGLTLPAGLTNLTTLYLGGNQLANFSFLSGLSSLTTLDLTGNGLTSLTLPLDLTNLTTLNLGGDYGYGVHNYLTNFSFLSGLRNLTTLDLSQGQLTNLSLPDGLTSLTNLDLGGDDLTSLLLPLDLTNLTTLNLSTSQLADLSVLSGLRNLTTLNLSFSQSTNFSFLSKLTSLTTLFLGGDVFVKGGLTNLNLPAGLTNLTRLDLYNNHLTNLTLPPGLENLTNLNLTRNPLTTFVFPEPLAGTNLAATVEFLRTNGVSVYTYPLGVGLRLASPQRTSTGAFGVALAGPPAVYNIFSSTDLATWNQVGIITNTLGAVVFNEPLATNSLHKLYRARLAK